MSEPYQIRVTRLSVAPAGEPIFSELCTHFTIVDEAGGEFVEVEQQSGSTRVEPKTIQVSPEEWPCFKNAVDRLMEDIGRHEKKPDPRGSGS